MMASRTRVAARAEELRGASKKLDAVRERKERLVRTEENMAGLVDFIANGERVQYIVQTLRDLETFAIQKRQAIADLEAMASAPLKLPSIAELDVDHMRERLLELAREASNSRSIPWRAAPSTGAAYTDTVRGAGTASLYVIDATSDRLRMQTPPNSGTLVDVGPLGADITDVAGFRGGGAFGQLS